MKWLFILFSIFKPFFSSSGSNEMPNPVEDIKDMIAKNAVKVMLAFAAVSALATIFAAGLTMVAVDIAAQYDQNAVVYFSTMIMLGITMMLIPVIGGGILVKMFDTDKDEEEKNKRTVLQSIGTVHPLQDALALLVQDFVKEREMKRTQEELTPRNPSAADKRHPTQSPTDSRVPSSDDFMH